MLVGLPKLPHDLDSLERSVNQLAMTWLVGTPLMLAFLSIFPGTYWFLKFYVSGFFIFGLILKFMARKIRSEPLRALTLFEKMFWVVVVWVALALLGIASEVVAETHSIVGGLFFAGSGLVLLVKAVAIRLSLSEIKAHVQCSLSRAVF
jgi:hypothetical protein